VASFFSDKTFPSLRKIDISSAKTSVSCQAIFPIVTIQGKNGIDNAVLHDYRGYIELKCWDCILVLLGLNFGVLIL
jgi:hypothetical protein